MEEKDIRTQESAPQDDVLETGTQLRKRRKEKKPGSRRWLMLVLLLVAVGLAVGAYFLATSIKPPEEEVSSEVPPTLMLVDRKTEEFAEATLVQGDASYTLVRDDEGNFTLKDAPNFTVEQSRARSIATAATYMRYDSVVEEPGDLSVYGLDAPSAVAEVTYTDGTSRTFRVGNATPTGSRFYCMEDGDPTVYIVYSSTGTYFATPRRDIHVASLTPVSADVIRTVTLTPRDQETINLVYLSGQETIGVSVLWLTSPIEYEADSEKSTALFDGIAGIGLLGYEDEATPETLAEYGLDTPRYHLVVEAVVDEAGNLAKAMELFIGDDMDETATYARIDGTNDVYRLDRASLAFLADVTVPKLVDRFANIINITKVDAIDVQAEGMDEHLTIERTQAIDEEGNPKTQNDQPVYDETFFINGEPMDDTTFRKLYQIIIGTRVDGMVRDGWEPAEDETPVITVRYSLNTLYDEEVIEYIPYDVDHYAVRRNGVCLFYILRSRVNMIPQALEAYNAGTFDPAAFGV